MLPSKGSCSVCSSSIRSEIDALIKQKIGFKKIAAQTGIAKSIVHRHSQKCIARERVEQHRSLRRFNPGTDRIFVSHEAHGSQPSQPPTCTLHGTFENGWQEQILDASAMRPNDILIRVTYEESQVLNPDALKKREEIMPEEIKAKQLR